MLFLSSYIYAQDFPGGINPDADYNQKSEPNGLYAGLSAKGVSLMGDWGLELGGRMGGFFNDYLSVGAGFYYLFTQTIHYKINDSPVEPHLRHFYFGAESEFHIPILDFISTSAFLGAYIGQVNEGIRSDVDISHELAGNWIFSLEPGFLIYFDVIDDISIGLSYQYRKSFGVDFKTLTDDDLSGNIISVSFITR